MKKQWLRLARREQHLVILAAVLLLAVGLWQWGISPAWRAVQEGPNKEAVLAQQASQVLRAAQTLETWRNQNARIQLSPKAIHERILSERSRLGLDSQVQVQEVTQAVTQAVTLATKQGSTNTPKALRLDFAQAPALVVLQYLDALEHTAGLRLHGLALEAKTAGMLTGYVVVHIQP